MMICSALLCGSAWAQPCDFTDDGVCDEPASCAFGTDVADCAAACAADQPPPTAFGACRFRAGVSAQDPPIGADLEARGSWGTGGSYGWSLHRTTAAPERGDDLVERLYAVYVPDRYDPARPAPLLFYGGGFGDDLNQSAYTDLNRLAELEGCIVVYTQQLYRDFGERGYRHSWYVYLQAFAGDWPEVPDLDYYRRVVREVSDRYNIDRTRVITTGTSRGAGLSVMFGFLAPGLFSGFVSQAGFATVNDFLDGYIDGYGGRTVPSVLVHGLLDDNVDPSESQAIISRLTILGWPEEDRLRSWLLADVGHQWQPQLSHRWYEWLYDRPLGLDEVER